MCDSKGFNMTKPIGIDKVEQTDNASHQMDMSADRYASDIAQYMIDHDCTINTAVSKFIADGIKHPRFKLFIGGSFFSSFEANPLAKMAQSVSKVYFGNNPATIRGNVIHLGREKALRHKIKTGNLLPFMECISAMRRELEERWVYMNPNKVANYTKGEIFLQVCRAFRLYYKNYLVNAEDIEVECGYKITFPLEIFEKPENAVHFMGSGTFDGLARRIENRKEVLIMVDAKSSEALISGKVEMNEKLANLNERKTSLLEAINKLGKTNYKFRNAEEKLADVTEKLRDVEEKLTFAKSNGKATTQLEKRLTKLGEEYEKWESNLSSKTIAETQKEIFDVELLEIEELMKPLMEEYMMQKKEADLMECRKKYETQLAYYSILESFKTGRLIDKLRIEHLACKKGTVNGKSVNKPEIQIFEWDLDQDILAETEEKVLTLIKTVEAVMDGLDPLVLYRPNTTTFYGSEFNELIEEVKEMVKNSKNEKMVD